MFDFTVLIFYQGRDGAHPPTRIALIPRPLLPNPGEGESVEGDGSWFAGGQYL
jgi:hypothetical protein